ncbi:hypothetical protein DLE60_19235 [Micromonospora globispora]|uniref:Uncharacterized protein n=1 Tax=Micromonospora globispora TaxID=1450148 RepID=A0A317K5G6_9ACTN|nr:hypothetical protein [Micromonospora globispora]PWU47182.1 hypothetical protein DLJ46_15510 [Micromonospora globispora]PWU58906.1 hypothetical protein DLE60_19235 [Micromonospora globispora]RQW88669.1 hypothetical protein DKL51_24450 [Micromonospora globispora]
MRPDPVVTGQPAGATEGLLSIEVELVTGRGRNWWPRPGRVFTAGPGHTFAELAEAIDVAFGRWDLAHLRMLRPAGRDRAQLVGLAGRAGLPRHPRRPVPPARPAAPGTSFAYVFDLGEDWTHMCTVRPADDRWPAPPQAPRPLCGWGSVPDQYGRNFADARPAAGPPGRSAAMFADFPAILPIWGTRP